ncbi:MAG TPA: hypothetical protein VGV60_10055 [Candidatus Polarisedimenticolia bacterium]|jgi:hypothetical protein|nr:hypothetical protein [Candidatus Polarisedimenticolia bacterium]
MLRSALPLLVLIVLLFPVTASAEPLTREKTPEPLRPWIDWVLQGHEQERCPFFQGDAETRQCAWPSRLGLDLSDRGGRFTQQWLLHRDEWVLLPGDARTWPQEVRVDGRPAIVAAQPGGPAVWLAAGRHAVSGTFDWDALPPLLQVPTGTGLVGLMLRGRAVPFPARDEQGRLWLQKRAGEETAEDRLEVTVNRRVADEIPQVLTTRVDLQVSGKGREVVLGRALPERFIAMSLRGPLPARIDPDGRLRAQVRPGRFSLELAARHEGPASTLATPVPDGSWPAQEVWVFDARPHLRLVSVEGVTAVDPQQTTLPDEWRQLPAYLMQSGKTMTLVEKRRGDSEPAPDQLILDRRLWLDFDGGGYTVHDAVAGTMRRTWRLEMPPPAVLGRVAIDGVDQFITRTGPDRPAGVELRQGEVRLDADSRVERGAGVVPAVGWDHDFNQVSAELNLPPAWRLFSASGVDDVSATWIASWTLLDLFLVLIGAMSVARLWGRRFGIIALLTLVLIWIEPGAPHWTWLAVLAFEALRRALPAGRILATVTVVHRLAQVVLVLMIIPFLVDQVRTALYPSLEEPWMGGGGLGGGFLLQAPMGEKGAATEEFDQIRGDLSNKMKAMSALKSNAPASEPAAEGKMAQRSLSYLYAPDPKTVVQTGPGLPDWSWRTVSLSWRGPVKQAQELRLVLIPPAANRLLNLLRVVLVSILALGLFGFPDRSWPARLMRRIGLARPAMATALASALALAGAGSPPAGAAEMPPADMLNELRTRLLQPPACRPNCASSPRMLLDVGPASLRARIEISAAAETAVPLPGGADQWLPDRVAVDGEAATGLVRTGEGRLWLRVSPGNHQVLMEGPLPDRESVPLPLPLKPHRVEARARGWRVEGLHEDGQAEDSLQLVQERGRERGPSGAFEPIALPPFVRVERELTLGIKWQVATRVVRITPVGSAVRLEVPLLPGESVTTADVRVAGDRALVSLAPQATEAAWTSSLDQRESIRLAAPGDVPWVEVWRLAAGPVWHVEVQGIPVVHLPEETPVRMREWRPWPGEAVTIDVIRPGGLPGQTLTIDTTDLTISPGLRATDASLNLTVRSSRGEQHVLTLPEVAELQSVSINGVVQPIRQDGRELTLPIMPGPQHIGVAWRQNDGIRLGFRAPEVDLGTASVNARTSIVMPADRWTLLLGGPRLGPAVLFWSRVVVGLLAAIALGRLRLTPLRARDWFLLSLGLTQAPVWISLVIVGWLFALGWRGQRGAEGSGVRFNLLQVLLAGATVVALGGLFWSITNGLLGLPEMQIAGNDSQAGNLHWYLDRSGEVLPRPWVVSVPLFLYRLAMLAWALWLAQALLRWLKWGWESFTRGGLWRPRLKKKPSPPPLAPPSPSAPGVAAP